MADPTKRKKTSKRNKTVISRELIGIGQETTENYLTFVYNTESCIFILNNNSSLWNLSHFSQHDSNSENQGHFKPPIEDITLTYKLTSLKQLDIFLYAKRTRFYLTKSLTTIWQFTSLWILSPQPPAKVAKTELKKPFRETNEITTSIPAVFTFL